MIHGRDDCWKEGEKEMMMMSMMQELKITDEKFKQKNVELDWFCFDSRTTINRSLFRSIPFFCYWLVT